MYLCVICLLGVSFLILPLADGADEPPFFHIPLQEAYEDEVFTMNISAYVEWMSPEGNLTFTDDSPLVETDPVTGILVWDSPGFEDVGEHFLTITMTDEGGRSSQLEISITVYHVCPGLYLSIIGRQRLTQGIPYEMDFSAYADESCIELISGLTYTNDHHELFVID